MASDYRPGGEPTEPPSEKRLKEARRRGEVPRSRECVSTAVLIACLMTLSWDWPRMMSVLLGFVRVMCQESASGRISVASSIERSFDALLSCVFPLLSILFLAALVMAFVQVGPLFSFLPIKPQLSRIHPLHLAKTIWGKKILVDAAMHSLKVIGLGSIACVSLINDGPILFQTLGRPLPQIQAAITQSLWGLTQRVVLFMAVCSLVDFLIEKRRFLRKMRMTKVELKMEYKETEGDPQHKAERQRLHQAIAEHQMLESVLNADCIIVNPDRIAVAIQYQPASMQSPKVIARGERLIAEKMKAIAKQHGIPIIRNVPVARALLELELDQEIPEALFMAVAEILQFVYRISGKDIETR